MMVRVNKQHLPTHDLDRLFVQLNRTLGKLNAPDTGTLLSELLGHEERLTIAKRLAAILLLTTGYSEYKTAKLLKLSPSTAQKIATQLTNGRYDGTLQVLGKNKKDYLAILRSLDSILHLGGILPHYGQTWASEEYKRNHKK